VYQQRGELGRACELLTRVVEVERSTLGPSHPSVAESLCNLRAVAAALEEDDPGSPSHTLRFAVEEEEEEEGGGCGGGGGGKDGSEAARWTSVHEEPISHAL